METACVLTTFIYEPVGTLNGIDSIDDTVSESAPGVSIETVGYTAGQDGDSFD
jgi:hypothetical protein